MKSDFRYNFIGAIDISDFNFYFNNDDWNYWTLKQTKWDVHSDTKTIPVILDEEYKSRGKKTKYYNKFNKLLLKIEKLLKEFYGDGHILRVEIVNLPKKFKVNSHVDSGDSLQNDPRVHLVLQTNDGVLFKVGGEEKNMKIGELWEINNTKTHSVVNNGDTDRIHMIIDYKKVNSSLL